MRSSTETCAHMSLRMTRAAADALLVFKRPPRNRLRICQASLGCRNSPHDPLHWSHWLTCCQRRAVQESNLSSFFQAALQRDRRNMHRSHIPMFTY